MYPKPKERSVPKTVEETLEFTVPLVPVPAQKETWQSRMMGVERGLLDTQNDLIAGILKGATGLETPPNASLSDIIKVAAVGWAMGEESGFPPLTIIPDPRDMGSAAGIGEEIGETLLGLGMMFVGRKAPAVVNPVIKQAISSVMDDAATSSPSRGDFNVDNAEVQKPQVEAEVPQEKKEADQERGAPEAGITAKVEAFLLEYGGTSRGSCVPYLVSAIGSGDVTAYMERNPQANCVPALEAWILKESEATQ